VKQTQKLAEEVEEAEMPLNNHVKEAAIAVALLQLLLSFDDDAEHGEQVDQKVAALSVAHHYYHPLLNSRTSVEVPRTVQLGRMSVRLPLTLVVVKLLVHAAAVVALVAVAVVLKVCKC
jgi:hypothetical protein